jgi:hypothetical protein
VGIDIHPAPGLPGLLHDCVAPGQPNVPIEPAMACPISFGEPSWT